MELKKCSNCKYRYVFTWDSLEEVCLEEACINYARTTTEEEEIKTASDCKQYEYGRPSCFGEDEDYYCPSSTNRDYCPSSTNRDYSPSNPWDAPGMSIRDFI